MIIGIEGPAGSGKTTMANTVAAGMDIPVVEGGAWYRALTFKALQEGIRPDDTDRLVNIAKNLEVDFLKKPTGEQALLINGEQAAPGLYSEEVSGAISAYSGNLLVREVIMPKIAKKLHQLEPVIIVGRHLHKISPEIEVLRLSISSEEADRRHAMRAGSAAESVAARNESDNKTARLLGTGGDNTRVLDVSGLDAEEQAEALRQFIKHKQNL